MDAPVANLRQPTHRYHAGLARQIEVEFFGQNFGERGRAQIRHELGEGADYGQLREREKPRFGDRRIISPDARGVFL